MMVRDQLAIGGIRYDSSLDRTPPSASPSTLKGSGLRLSREGVSVYYVTSRRLFFNIHH